MMPEKQNPSGSIGKPAALWLQIREARVLEWTGLWGVNTPKASPEKSEGAGRISFLKAGASLSVA